MTKQMYSVQMNEVISVSYKPSPRLWSRRPAQSGMAAVIWAL